MPPGARAGVAGAVLTGGASTRMGRDKALLPVRGRALAVHVSVALREAGVDEVVCIGGDLEGLSREGLLVVADLWPGDGPLGGILTAMESSPAEILVIAAGDLLNPSGDAFRQVIHALGDDADLAVPHVAGRTQWLHGAWRRASALPVLHAAFDRGERSVHRATEALRIRLVDGVAPDAVSDADTPDDLGDAALDPDGELP